MVSSSSIITIVLLGMISISGSLVVIITKKSSCNSWRSSLMIVVLKQTRVMSGLKVRLMNLAM